MKKTFVIIILLFSVNSYADRYKVTFESITVLSTVHDSGLGVLSSDVEPKIAIGCPHSEYADNKAYKDDTTLVHPDTLKATISHSVIPGSYKKPIKESLDFDYDEMEKICKEKGRTLYLMLLEEGTIIDSVIQYMPFHDITSKLTENPNYPLTFSNLGYTASVLIEKI